jgi:DNA-binding FadR family transcriptional regulator
VAQTLVFAQLPREQSRHQMVVQRLRDAIEQGYLSVGEPVPSERELCEQLGVSRTIVREAIRVLSAQGILTVSQGRRAVVAADLRSASLGPIRQLVEDTARRTFSDILDARLILEVACAERAAQRAGAADLAAMQSALDGLRTAPPHSRAAEAAHLAFHRAVAQASNNLFVAQMVMTLLESRDAHGPRPAAEDETRIDIALLPLGYESHAKIFRPIRDHRVAAARRAMHEHLSVTIQHHPGLHP